MANINDFKAKLAGGGARANQFKVTMPFPGYAQVGGEIEDLAFLCTTAQIPAMNVGLVNVPFRGRQIKIAGDRTFEDWEVTVINDEDFAVRNAMEIWSNSINTHVTNLRDRDRLAPETYKAQAQVRQYSKTGDMIREYTFNGLFPTNVAQIDVAWETNNTVEEFAVTFSYDWWEVTNGTTGISTS